MDNKEMIRNFGDMVEATERMSKPWQEELKSQKKHSLILFIVTNVCWAIVFVFLIYNMYKPVETTTQYQLEQTQDSDNLTQSQHYDYDSTTNGD